MKWFYFILSHSIFIAVCAVALAFQTDQLLHLNNNLFIYGFIFFATLCSYNFYWILSKISFVEKGSVIRLLIKETTGIYLFIFSAAALLYCLLKSALPVNFVITAILLTILYSLPLLPFKPFRFTRRAGILKTILLAFTWVYVTAFIPMQKAYLLLDKADLFMITQRFLYMLILCIIFDNRDKAVDKIRGMHSLATVVKPAVLTFFIFFIFAVLFISPFFYNDYGITFYQAIALQVSTLASLTVYLYAAKKRNYLFYYFITDGLMLFSFAATYIASI